MTGMLTAIILAGGKGTRLASIYSDVPKPLVPVHGRPFLDWMTAGLVHQGVRHFIYSVGYKAEQIEAWAKNFSSPKIVLQTVREDAPLGTGGGALNALSAYAGNAEDWVVILNGDSLIATDLRPFFALISDEGLDGALVGIEVEDASRYGTLEIQGGCLTGFLEKRPGEGVVNAGVYLFKRRVLESLNWLGETLSMEYDVIPRLIAGGAKLQVFVATGAPFIDIGTPETVAQAEHFIDQNRDWFAM